MDPIEGLDRGDRVSSNIELLHPGPGDLFWDDPNLNYHDLRQEAWIETDDRTSLYGFNPGGPPSPEIASMSS